VSDHTIEDFAPFTKTEAISMFHELADRDIPPPDTDMMHTDMAQAIAVLLGIINDMEIVVAFNNVFLKYGGRV